MTSMLTNYANLLQVKNNTQAPQQKGVIPAVINQESLKTGVAAYAPKGHLVKDSFLKSLATPFVQDYQNIKNFFKAINGKGTDYSIGRINDTAIKLGSLGIAAILASSKGSPLRKGMEFIGLGCWFGAMSLWPKLAVYAPIKLTKGVDLELKYVDSYGRKKLFSQDPQYICWDLISDKELNRIGDKLGVPRNIDDRKGAIRDKYKQISVQGNTIAMMTAGFATPLVASLAADQIGKHVYSPLLGKIQNASAAKALAKLDGHIDKIHTNQTLETQIENMLKGSSLDEKLKSSVKALFKAEAVGTETQETVALTVDKIFKSLSGKEAVTVVDDNLAQEIIKTIQGSQKRAIDPRVQTILDKLPNSIKGKTLNRMEVDTYIAQVKNTLIKNRVLTDNRRINQAVENLNNLFKSKATVQMANPQAAVDKLKDVARMIQTYKVSVNQSMDKVLKATVLGDSSNIAKLWESTFKKVIQAFDIKGAALKELAATPSIERRNEILEKALRGIVSPDGKFEQTVKSLQVIADNAIETNKKALETSLKYLDNMEEMFAKNFPAGELKELHNQFAIMISQRRQNLIAKYVSTNNTFQAPLRMLSVFDNLKADLGTASDYMAKLTRDYGFDTKTIKSLFDSDDAGVRSILKNVNLNFGEDKIKDIIASLNSNEAKIAKQSNIIKNMLFDSLNVDNFINKFDKYKLQMNNQKAYDFCLDTVLGPLGNRVKGAMSNSAHNTADVIDQNNRIFRVLFTDLCDDVNMRFGKRPSLVQTVETLKGSVIGNYMDDFFNIGKNGESTEYAKAVLSKFIPSEGNGLDAIQKFNYKLPIAAQKGVELSQVPYINLKEFYSIADKSAYDRLTHIKHSGNKNLSLINEFYEQLNSYAKNGKAKIRTFFTLFNEKDLTLGADNSAIRKLFYNSNLGYAKPGKLTDVGGKVFGDFLQESAQQVLSYKSWFTRVGIALGVLAGVTAVAVAMVGRKNAFNPDVYEKKKGA
ncbi:MAG: hypothetical protein PHX18_04790 [Candidatus Gastranaerophilales bacterium]|nr:hypothetical protein [Candidatus Gastranaerophilales bacterium]